MGNFCPPPPVGAGAGEAARGRQDRSQAGHLSVRACLRGVNLLD